MLITFAFVSVLKSMMTRSISNSTFSFNRIVKLLSIILRKQFVSFELTKKYVDTFMRRKVNFWVICEILIGIKFAQNLFASAQSIRFNVWIKLTMKINHFL